MKLEVIASRLNSGEFGPPKYEQIASAVETAVEAGSLRTGDRLPTVRALSSALGVSATTITAAFNLLSERGVIRGEVGRGTFIARSAYAEAPPAALAPPNARETTVLPWRKKALASSAGRLHRAFPNTVDCSTGRPDPSVLPTALIRKAWKSVAERIEGSDLQYAGPEPVPELAAEVAATLSQDGIDTRASALVVGSSAQQLMVLSLEIAEGRYGRGCRIAVEEPGYPAILDTAERLGFRLQGMEVDHLGATPRSLEQALRAGARLALFTPRAQNPTGASWSPQRARELADVLAEFPDVMILEDDQFAGIAAGQSPSMFADDRLAERVVYVRSFSKSLGPDLRMAIAVVRPSLRVVLEQAKAWSDGWSSRLLQRVVASLLADAELAPALEHARACYEERRRRAAAVLDRFLLPAGGGVWPAGDGVNLWVRLPPGVDVIEALEAGAAAGVLAAPGEPFFIRPGATGFIRFNACSVDADTAERAASRFAQVVVAATPSRPVPVHV